jgi:serine/threonine protein kinase
MAEPADKKLYEHVKKLADKKFHSKTGIYKSSWIVSEYKRLGGKYLGSKPRKSGLKRWYKEKWVDLNKPIVDKRGKIVGYKECGRKKIEKKDKYPLCRPSVRVSKKTPRTYKEITKRSIKRAKVDKQKVKGKKNIQFGKGKMEYPKIGQQLDINGVNYTIEKELEKGGFKTPYLAKINKTNEKVVIFVQPVKDIPEMFIDNFKREIRIIKEVKKSMDEIREDIIYPLSYQEPVVPDKPGYLVTKYFEGQDLYNFLYIKQTHKKISLNKILEILIKICQSLDYLHNTIKFAHIDIKPENLMINENNDEIYLIDLGHCCNVVSVQFLKGGTLEYAAPELFYEETPDDKQRLEKVLNDFESVKRIDIWSLGCLFYNFLYDKDILFNQESKNKNDILKMYKYREYSKLRQKILSSFKYIDSDILLLEPLKELDQLIMNMVHIENEKRPNIKFVLKELMKIKSRIPNNRQNVFEN